MINEIKIIILKTDQNTLIPLNKPVYIYEKVLSKSLRTHRVCTFCYILNQLKGIRFFYKRNEVSLLRNL